jgi:glycosyltransferase involved in cell wall biosynthesis
MINVVYWTNIPAPYMVDRFNAVAARRNVAFEAWFSSRTESDRSWKVDESTWLFPHRYLPTIGRGGALTAVPTPLLREPAPDIFVSLYAGTGYLAGSALARRRGSRTAFWVEPTFDALVRRRRWKEALKSRVFPNADGILTTGQDGRAFARRYGAVDERIHHVPHVIDFEPLSRAARSSHDRRDEVRAELALRGVTYLYVGRLWEKKGLTYLLDAFGELQRRSDGEVSLLLVGDGLDEGHLRSRVRANGLQNVVFCGFQHEDVLPRYYAASDVFVFPTLGDTFGMVVLEAMACGLPVIATTASGEIAERVVDDVNGFLVAPASSDQLLERMELLGREDELRLRMGRASVEKAAGQSPQQWAELFEQAIANIVAMPPARHSKAASSSVMRPTAARRG